MTQGEWDHCTDPQAMLDFLRSTGPSERKLRLFAVGCCRRIWSLLSDERSRHAVDIAEAYAEGRATSGELSQALGLAWRAYHGFLEAWVRTPSVATEALFHARMRAAEAVGWVTQDDDPRTLQAVRERQSRIELVLPVVEQAARLARIAVRGNEPSEEAAQADLLRDIVAPFRTTSFDPAWRTPSVMELARRAYEQCSFDLLPALGAALSDAGCTDPEILRHCGSEKPHVRGCWVLDLLLKRA